MARFHTLDVPTPRTDVDWLVGALKSTSIKHKQRVAAGIDLPPPVNEVYQLELVTIIHFDNDDESKCFAKDAPQNPMRNVFTHDDVNRGNVLFKMADKDEEGNQLSLDDRVVLVDYEFSAYQTRGK